MFVLRTTQNGNLVYEERLLRGEAFLVLQYAEYRAGFNHCFCLASNRREISTSVITEKPKSSSSVPLNMCVNLALRRSEPGGGTEYTNFTTRPVKIDEDKQLSLDHLQRH